MVASQVRCKAVEEANAKLEAERRHQEGEMQGLRQQVLTLREAGRAAQDWQAQLDMLIKGGATVLAPFSTAAGATRAL